MKVLWISPAGSGAALAARIAEQHDVTYFCPDPHNAIAAPGAPRIASSALDRALAEAERIVVDGAFTPGRGNRSIHPSRWIQRIWDTVSRLGKRPQYRGPTPATELLEYDPRYLRKVLRRIGVPNAASDAEETLTHLTPEGQAVHEHVYGARTVLRGGEILPPAEKVLVFLRELGYNGPVTVGQDPEGSITRVTARLFYPAAYGLAHMSSYGSPAVALRAVNTDDTLQEGEILWLTKAFVKDGKIQAPGRQLGVGSRALPRSPSP